jgi:hypothetical protein
MKITSLFEACFFRIVRGSVYRYNSRACGTAERARTMPYSSGYSLGIRPCRS